MTEISLEKLNDLWDSIFIEVDEAGVEDASGLTNQIMSYVTQLLEENNV